VSHESDQGTKHINENIKENINKGFIIGYNLGKVIEINESYQEITDNIIVCILNP
jgi:hypothetical protein